MRKFLFILVLLCFSVQAQDSLETEPPKVRYTIADIQRDSSDVAQKNFGPAFKEKYRSEEFDYEPKAKQQTLWDRFLAWLGKILSNLFSIGGESAISLASVILRVLAVVLIVVVIYLIVKSIMNKEGQWIFGRGAAKRIITAEEIERNIQAADFEKLISETLAKGDQRLAVRYYYLWLLQKFSKRGIIEWDIEKTNSDYLYEIKNEGDKKDFAYLSYLYNYIWYGEFEVDEIQFDKAKTAFETTLKRIR